MGLTIVLETETGEGLERVEDHANVLHRLLPGPEDVRYQCIGAIDWYGDTIFNYLQARQFLEEWRQVSARVCGVAEAAIMMAIEKMAERVAKERHLYLKFYGD
jgi:RNA binding exosome subunit